MFGNIKKRCKLFFVKRLFAGICFDIVLQLLHIGHTAQSDGNIVKSLYKAESPCRYLFIWSEGNQSFCILGIERSELAAAYRLHDPYRNIVFLQKLIFFFCALQSPVKIIELNLTEFDYIAIDSQKLTQIINKSMAGKAEMANPSLPFLLFEIIDDTPLRIGIYFD